MLKAGQMFYHQGSLFALKYDAAEIKGTLVEGVQYSPSSLPYNAQALVEELLPYNFAGPKAVKPSTLQCEFKVTIDTSEIDAAIAKLEKLQKLQETTTDKVANIWTKNDLHVGQMFAYCPSTKGHYWKITGFKGKQVKADLYEPNLSEFKDCFWPIESVLARLNNQGHNFE